MKLTKQNIGAILFIGTVQFLLFLIIAEALYPCYSTSANYISDLGVGSTAIIFNCSIVIFGVLAAVSGYYLFFIYKDRVFSALIILAGIGAVTVGLFPETAGIPHYIGALMVFGFGALAALYTYAVEKKPFAYLSVILGFISLIALSHILIQTDYGLGVGGIERMIAYPIIIWTLALGAYLMASSKKK